MLSSYTKHRRPYFTVFEFHKGRQNRDAHLEAWQIDQHCTSNVLGAAGKGKTMDIGFETIGNATLICHDGRPVLVTYPWIKGSADFGSWALSHQIPDEQMNSIEHCEFVWLSHGHPDHLSAESLQVLDTKKWCVHTSGDKISCVFLRSSYTSGRQDHDFRSMTAGACGEHQYILKPRYGLARVCVIPPG